MSKIRKKQHSWSVPSSGDLFPLVASKKEIAEGLHKVTRRVVRRLIKIANFPECSHVERWEGELYQLLHNISKLPSNKLPSKEFILKHTYNCAEDLIVIWNVDIYDDYYETLDCSEVDCRDVHRAVGTYFRSLAAWLSENGEISRKECNLLIDSFYCNVFANSL